MDDSTCVHATSTSTVASRILVLAMFSDLISTSPHNIAARLKEQLQLELGKRSEKIRSEKIDAELKNLEQSVRDILAKIKNTEAKIRNPEDTLAKVYRNLMCCLELELELTGSRLELVESVAGFIRDVEEVFQQQLQEGCDTRTIERLLNALHDTGKVVDRHVLTFGQ
ncbi:hypothetical protein CPB97_006225 [Podila verticillata]|nr:hypothetical protein CPB97_006225 [Podila verticillata]